MVTPAYAPMVSGTARVVEILAEQLVQRGHQVLVLAPSDSGKPYRKMQQNGVRLVRFRSLPNPFRGGQLYNLWPEPFLVRFLSEFNPDLVHLHDALTAGLATLRVCRRMQLPTVLTIHQTPAYLAASAPEIPVLRRAPPPNSGTSSHSSIPAS